MSEKRSVLLLLFVAGCLLFFGARRVHYQQKRVRLGYELSEARRELAAVGERNRQLRVEYSVLSSPERIRTLAAALGMQQPEPGQLRVTGDAGQARPTTARSVARPEVIAE